MAYYSIWRKHMNTTIPASSRWSWKIIPQNKTLNFIFTCNIRKYACIGPCSIIMRSNNLSVNITGFLLITHITTVNVKMVNTNRRSDRLTEWVMHFWQYFHKWSSRFINIWSIFIITCSNETLLSSRFSCFIKILCLHKLA